MTRFLHHAAFAVGLAAVGWIGAGGLHANPFALAMTVLIGAFYLAGAFELQRYRRATATLARAVDDAREPPASLGAWLAPVHASLQSAVRLRVEGERIALPGPVLTPYLVGLLVLLGMLGTFLGMVVTLNGTGMALESATDLQAIRASLAAPVKGLGLAFGTSVAGVAASAALGLMSALCRRERLQAAQALDARVATTLRAFSRAHQREASLALLQRQAEAMPALVDRLQAMTAALERQAEASNARLAASQESFHARTEAAYAGLAASVERSLKESLADSARVAGATIRPAVEAAMSGIARETAALHESVAGTVQRQLDGMSTRFEAATRDVANTWNAALAQQARAGTELSSDMRGTLDRFAETFEQRSAALLRTVDEAHAGLHAAAASHDAQRLAAWTGALESMAGSLRREWQDAGAQTLGRQQEICRTLERTAGDVAAQAQAHAAATIAEIARLVQAASEAPRAAAEVIGELRRQVSQGMARDNAVLEERARLMETLATLLDAVNRASAEQRGAVDALVASSAAMLERAGAGFAEKVDAEAARMAAAGAQVAGSAAEVASLGEAFGVAVELFGNSSQALAAHLQRLEAALGKSIARSDEQLAYYVAQAREIVDLSLASQKQIVEDLQRLASRRAAVEA